MIVKDRNETYRWNYYYARIVRHKDGDTTIAEVDLGQGVTRTDPDGLRWRHIDAPSMATPEGRRVWERLNELLPPGSTCWVRTHRREGDDEQEKYGRYLADFFSLDFQVYYNQVLLDEGLVKQYEGRGPKS